MEVDAAVLEPPVIEELEVEANAAWQGGLAAADDDRADDEVVLVDEAGVERLGPEFGAADHQVPVGGGLEGAPRVGFELRSMRVRVVVGSGRVVEYTILVAACQMLAKSASTRGPDAKVAASR